MKKVSVLLSIVVLCGIIATAGCSGGGGSKGGNNLTSSSSKEITSFEIINPVTASGVIDESGKTVNITVPYGTGVTKIIVKFVSTGVKTSIGSVEQISSTTVNDFTNPLKYTVTAEDGSTSTYTVTVAISDSVASLPVANPAGSAVYTGTSVTLSSTAGSTIYYTLDGNNPTTASASVASGSQVTVNPPVTLKAYAALGMTTSGIMTESYTLLSSGVVAAPVASVASGLVASGTSVSLTCATTGADIYYTLDNTAPSLINGTKYTAPITVTANTTILAIAVKYGLTNSALLTAVYTVQVEKPVISPAGGTIVSGTGVSISCGTSGAVIYYTTNGDDPTTECNVYSTPITVTAAMKVKAMAAKASMVTSDIAEVNYTIASANADLSSLVISAGTLSPVFDSSVTSYTASVDYSVTSITVTPTLADATASVTVNTVAVTSGTASGAIGLSVGANTITIAVTSQSGVIKTYVVTLERFITTKTGSGIASKITYNLPGGTVFSEIQTTADSVTSFTFPMGTEDASTGTITAPFMVSETDVTYQLWKEVYDWATNSARGTAVYSFGNAGQNGTGVSSTTSSTQYPVTNINWRDSIVWCNALTEYYNANNGGAADLDVVYCSDALYKTPIRTSTNSTTITYSALPDGSQDSPCVNASAKGFRLLTSEEYEYAARYIGVTRPSDYGNYNWKLSGGIYYTKGNSASGAYANFSLASYTTVYAVYSVSATAEVKSKNANALGLYDMSGNVNKCIFDWYWTESGVASYRMTRGGCFSMGPYYLQIGYADYWEPYAVGTFIGVRFSRSK
jgi:formylglycine-generating enzyme required for sulfatase activity